VVIFLEEAKLGRLVVSWTEEAVVWLVQPLPIIFGKRTILIF
jgi:hypothetical protein